MRILAALSLAFVAFLTLSVPGHAGILELKWDNISTHRNCAAFPCRGNNLVYKRIFIRDRYLRFDIHTTPPVYKMRRIKVMVLPPRIVVAGHYRTDRWGHLHLVRYPVGPYKVVAPAKYAYVTTPMLVQPARNYVTRRHPYYAYYPDKIVVYHRCDPVLGWGCRRW